MTYKVGPKGQVVIPKLVREEIGIEPGDEVVVEASDGVAHVRRVVPLEGLRGMFAGGPSMTDELEAERAREREREERKIEAFHQGRPR